MSDIPENVIRHAEAIAPFLQNESVRAVFDELHQRYFAAFKSALTPADREMVWAQARALDDLRLALQAVVDAGKYDLHLQEQHARRS